MILLEIAMLIPLAASFGYSALSWQFSSDAARAMPLNSLVIASAFAAGSPQSRPILGVGIGVAFLLWIGLGFSGVKESARSQSPMRLLVLLTALGVALAGIRGTSSLTVYGGIGASLAVAFIVAVQPARCRAGSKTLSLLSLFVGIILVRGMLATDSAWILCRSDKCSFAGQLYSGPFASENAISLLGCFGLALILARPRSNRALLAAPTFALMLIVGGGRSSAGAIVLAVLMSLLVSLVVRGLGYRSPRYGPVSSGIFTAGVVIAFVAAPLLFASRSPDLLSGRGRIWNVVGGQISSSPILGVGPDGWIEAQAVHGLGDLSPHSLYLTVWLSTGAIGLVLLWAVFWVAVRRSVANGRTLAASPVTVLMVLGATEAIWDPGSVTALSVIFMLVLSHADTEGQTDAEIEMIAVVK